MDRSVEVVIVGGGVVGLACAAALVENGVRDVIVIDRNPGPAQGSTARANGGIRAQWSTRVNIEFSLYSIACYERMHATLDGLPGLIQAGYLFFTGTPEGESRLRRNWELQRSLGVPAEWLTPGEVLAKAPYLRAEGLRAGTFSAKDGFIDPHGASMSFFQLARQGGATVLFDTEVRAITTVASGHFELATSSGRITSRWLVNAAGPEARDLARMLGVDVPVVPVRRNLACTDAVDGYPPVIPMCIDLDTGVLIRRESGGFLLAWSDPNDPPGTDSSLDPGFLEALAERIGNRFPFIESIPIDPRRCWAGLYPETPDHHAIVGPTPSLPRFLHAIGFGGHGIMHAPATGRAIAELITRGASTTLDIHPFRLARFAEGDLIDETAVL